MARDHARILCRIWSDEDFKARSKGAQWMYFVLTSQRSLNNAGVLPMTLQRWANCSAGTTVEQILGYLNELSEHKYVVFDAGTEELLIRSHIRNDGVAKQPNLLKNALERAGEVDSPKLRLVLASELRRLDRDSAVRVADELDPQGVGTHAEPIANPSGTPNEPRISNPSETLPDGLSICAGVGEGGSTVVKSLTVVGSVGAPSQAKSAATKRGTRLPEDWRPSEAMFAYGREHGPDLNLDLEVENFRDYWLAKAGKDAVKVDWDRTWQRWVRLAQEKVPAWKRQSAAVDEIDPDAVLGADVWTVPTPPPEIRDGPHEGIAAWHEQKRAERLQERLAEARGVLTRRAA